MSLRPRMGEQDSLTGDFLTGTGPGGIAPGSREPMQGMQDPEAALRSGRSAYERQDWKGAVDAFKGALALDPGNPEAHAFLGVILLRAGHGDEALLAIERGLKRDPGYPLALWAKGLVLFEAKQDYVGAVRVWEALMGQSLAAADADQVSRMIAEARKRLAAQPPGSRETTFSARIAGTVSLAPSLSAKIPAGSALFIIARRESGPPRAVKRIADPTFPVVFTLGPEDVMLRRAPFDGEVTLTARLKRDGTAGPAVPGDLEGTAKTPVRVGQSEVQIVLDQIR